MQTRGQKSDRNGLNLARAGQVSALKIFNKPSMEVEEMTFQIASALKNKVRVIEDRQ